MPRLLKTSHRTRLARPTLLTARLASRLLQDAAIMAAGSLVTVPLIIMVLVFQRRIVAGLTAGGVKG